MKGTENQIQFAKSIISSRTALDVDFSEIKIGGDWRTCDEGRAPTDAEVSALKSLISEIELLDCANAVISTKNRGIKSLLKAAESTISTKFPIMNKDAYIAKLSAANVLVAAELIRAI